jgi:hypothetical protein
MAVSALRTFVIAFTGTLSLMIHKSRILSKYGANWVNSCSHAVRAKRNIAQAEDAYFHSIFQIVTEASSHKPFAKKPV